MALHGRLTSFQVATNEIGPYCNSVQFERDNDTHDVTAFGASGHAFIGGLTNGKITVQGWWDKTATVGSQTVFSPLAVVASAATAFIYGPEGSTTGKVKYSGSFILESYVESAPVADIVTFTATMQITGSVTVGTFP